MIEKNGAVDVRQARGVTYETLARSIHWRTILPPLTSPLSAVALMGNSEHTTPNAAEFATPRLVPGTISERSLIRFVKSF